MELTHIFKFFPELEQEKEVSKQYYLLIQIVYLGLEAQDNQRI